VNVSSELAGLKVAIVHEWLVNYSGAERVLEQLVNVFPQADLYAVVEFLPDEMRGFIRNKPVTTTFIQRLPFARRAFRAYLGLMPLAVEQLDLSGYDLVVSSSYAVAKGVLTGPNQLHISYVHTPIRYAWDLQHQYLSESGLVRGLKSWAVRWTLHKMRLWDVRTANGVDFFVANSAYIARRIRKAYRREATVIYPPVDVQLLECHEKKEDYFLTASRMVPYKRVPLIVDAFASMPEKNLIVIGDGPELAKVIDRAKGKANISVLGYQSSDVLYRYMKQARAFVFAAEEDFGIMPVEAQACGTPVIAFRRGGVAESVAGLECAMPTGIFFDEQTAQHIIDAVERFEMESGRISARACRVRAEAFSSARFRCEFAAFALNAWQRFLAESC
jgi:glycosyltransferase involved in cell wall biosynthesis